MEEKTAEKRALYLECNAGISGDMAVAALIDAGADREALDAALRSIPADGFQTEIRRVSKGGVDCCDFNVILDAGHENHDHDMEYLFGHEHGGGQHEHVHEHDHHDHAECAEHHCHEGEDGLHHHDHHHDEHHHDSHEHDHDHHDHEHVHDEHEHQHGHHHHHEHRGLAEINAVIDATQMTEGAKALARKIFRILAESESKAHNVPVEQVHFHEVGAIDSIVDIIALAVCFDNLGVGKVYVPSLTEGRGSVRCQHGILPVPVPAVANIVSAYGIPLELCPTHGEFVTPTGAAFVAA
ncbi:MAG: LarC family nickel insertion protein, partial [Treponema sp.]|nr:LarC family nickel insertion protein [Treponema sp.]